MPARLLHLPKWYPHRYDPQDGDFVLRHVAAIAAATPGTAAAVVLATVARAPLPRLVVEDVDPSGPVPAWRYYYRAAPTGWAALDKILKLGLYYYCLGRGLRRVRAHWGGRGPTLVHVHVLLRSGLFAWWLRRTADVPYVITEHATRYLPGRAQALGRGRRWLLARVVAAAAGLHTVSENLRQALAALGASNPQSTVIPNVVDTDLFHPEHLSFSIEHLTVGQKQEAATERQAPDITAHAQQQTRNKKQETRNNNPTLLHVAAFNEAAKNLTGLLRTVAALRPTLPGLRLRIAGYGPDEALVRRAAAALGLLADGTAVFLGQLAHPQVAAEMRRASAFVLFSHFENLPCVLIEAQASGLPAVATRVGGVPELLGEDGRFGRLVPPADEAALALALRQVLAAPFDPAALRANAVARYGVAAVGRAFAVWYAAVLPGPGRQMPKP